MRKFTDAERREIARHAADLYESGHSTTKIMRLLAPTYGCEPLDLLIAVEIGGGSLYDERRGLLRSRA